MAEPAAGDTHAEGDVEGGAPAAAELATNDEVLVDLKQVDEVRARALCAVASSGTHRHAMSSVRRVLQPCSHTEGTVCVVSTRLIHYD